MVWLRQWAATPWLKLHLTGHWNRSTRRPCFLSSLLTIMGGLHGPFEATELQRGQKGSFSMYNNNRQLGSVAWFASRCRNGVHAHWLSRFLCFNDVCVLKGRHCRTLQLVDQWFQSNQSLNEARNSGATTFFQTLQWLILHVTPECSKHAQLVWTFCYTLLWQRDSITTHDFNELLVLWKVTWIWTCNILYCTV